VGLIPIADRVLYSDMPTFIDESGDTGPFSRGGKPYFRLAAVWVPSLDEADRFRESIRALRIQPGMWGNRELKFAETHSHPEWRKVFLQTALAQEFYFAVSLFDKEADPYWEQASHAEFLWASTTELAALLRPVYIRAESANVRPLKEPVFLDDNRDGKFLAAAKKQFRGLKSNIPGRASLIGAVVFHGSKADEMIQLIDMICGSVGALVDEKDATCYSLISERDMETRVLT
jgi:Protein of unknown function (DUF3800)